MSARAELIFNHFARVVHFARREFAFFELIKFAREQNVSRHRAPVEIVHTLYSVEISLLGKYKKARGFAPLAFFVYLIQIASQLSPSKVIRFGLVER